MGSKSASQQNTSSATTADPQAAHDYNQVINRAKQVSNTPYQAYSGELTAGVNTQENTATSAMNGLGAAANGYYSSAAQQSGLGAAAVNPTAVNGAAISQYESPYQQDVINSTMAQIDQQNKIQQNQQTSNAIGAGAFGGDRAGLASAALSGQQALATNSTLANLNNQNYSQALGEANTQQSVGLGAAQANRTALQQNAETLAGIGSAATSSGLGVANAQLGAGALQQQTQQAADTAQYAQFEQKQAYPFQTEQYLANIVGGLAPNYGSSTVGQTTTQTSPLNSILGLSLGAAALAPGVSSIGSGLSSLGSGLGNLFSLSDRRAKEGIRKIGKSFDGQPIYAFRYKGDPDGRTQLGMMAQEVERRHPEAVGNLGELKVVDYAEATRKAADKGHFARGGRTVGDLYYHGLSRDEVEHLDGDEPRGLSVGEMAQAMRTARAAGGAVGPYADADGYVPVSQGVGAARMLTSPSPSPSQPTNPIPSFTQFAQAGQGLGALASGAGTAASGLGQAANFMSSPRVINFADGGKVVGLGAARTRRDYDGGVVGIKAARGRPGYDAGGVVGTDALMFDPDALSSIGQFQPGVGVAPALQTMTPSPSGGVAPAAAPSAPPQGLGAASNDNPPVPVAPAPNVTPVVGYRQADGTVTPAPGLGGATQPAPSSAPAGLGSAATAPDAISAATAPRSVRNNNPGNVVDGSYAQGLPGYAGSDGRFAVFRTADDGASAMDGLLHSYGAKGLNTPLAIVSRWAPAGDGNNDPTAYAGSVAKQLGIGINTPIDMSDPGQRAALGRAMAQVEGGGASGGVGGARMPSSALGYAGGPGLGAAATATTGLGAAATPSGLGVATAGLGASDTSATKGGLGSALGFGAGGDGGLLGLSDDARLGLLGMAGGLAASTSRNFGVALGQGAQAGLQTYGQALDRNREAGLARAKIANATSEIQNRTALQGIEKDRVALAGQELTAHLQQVQQQGGNYKSEDAYRKAQTGNEATRVALERYQLFPGPDGSFRYLDKANPGRGLLTAAQVPELAAAAGPATAGGSGSPVTAGASPMAGTPATAVPGSSIAGASAAAPPLMNGPSALKSDGFMKTGRPTLAAPQGYLPTNWWGNNVRMQSDPVAREAAGAQTKEDVTNASVAAQKANTALYYSDEMDRNMDTLSKSGLLQPGAAFPERLNLAKSYNLAAGSIGLPTVDEKATAAGQSLVKDQTRLASQLTSSLGSREAASVFSSMMAATPGASNTTAGYKGISSSIRVLAQRDIDRNAFVQNYQSRYGSTGEADVAFNALNPPMAYARHAQMLAKIPQRATDLLRSSANDPRAVASFEQVYGPGTARYFTGAQ